MEMAGLKENYKHKLVKNALYSIDNFEVFPLVLNKIKNVQGSNDISFCNAAESFSFKDAVCRVEREPKDHGSQGLVKLRRFKNIFLDGVEALERYIKNDCLPKEKGAKIAIENLLRFFEKYSKSEAAKKLFRALHEVRFVSEVTIILAHHLLSQLVVSPAYTIDQRGRGSNLSKCPCCMEELTGTFGDTSIGSTRVWHGHFDILFDHVSVECISSLDNDDDNDNDGDDDQQLSSVDVKCKQPRKSFINTKTKEHLRAQNIVFSFLQRRFHPDLQHFMVPHIGISEDKVQLYFYDCEHDILIETRQENLFVSEDEINMKTVVGLWLVLNYRYFCSGVTHEMKAGGFTAGFLKNDKTRKRIYDEEMKFGCGSPSYDHGANLDYKDNHDFVENETPLKKQRIHLYSDSSHD